MLDLQLLVDSADSAALLRAIDGLCASRQWDALSDLARRCRRAMDVGKQLWPIAMHIDYRLALQGPPSHAAAVLEPGAARFALGPLTEVAASNHDWAGIAPHIRDPASAAAVAQERVIRGEDLRDVVDGLISELPLRLAHWEPNYALPHYRDREAAFPQPEAAAKSLGTALIRRMEPSSSLDEDRGAQALRDLVETWVTQSAGRARAVTVEGDAEGALGRLLADTGREPAAAIVALEPADALAILQWAGASGGAYGRRRGGARGRFATWWAAAALAGLDWPVEPDVLGEAIGELLWYRWALSGPEPGWALRLAVTDPVDEMGWAIEATDQRTDDPTSGPSGKFR
ncbi:MAG: DUF6183 family protein [Egibacteraceae bacterium]